MRVVCALCCLVFIIGVSAGARADNEVEIGAKVPGYADLTYFDLLKQVIADLTMADGEATGTKVRPFRHIVEGFGADAPESVGIRMIDFRTMEAEGRKHLLVLADLGASELRAEKTVILILFDAGPKPTLLDVVDVGMDRLTSLGEPPLLRIGPKDQAVVTTSSHGNSNQSYRSTALIAVQQGQFRLIDTFSTFGDRYCKGDDESINSQSLSFATQSSEGGRYRTIRATVLDRKTVKKGACGGKEGRLRSSARRWSTSYRWSEAKQTFTRSSDALKRLEIGNEQRF
jgi:hypothetical protein